MQLQSASPNTKIVLTGYSVPKGPLTWHPSAACSEFRSLEPLNQLVKLGEKQGDFFSMKKHNYQFHKFMCIYLLYDICIFKINRDIEFSFIFHLNKYFWGGGGFLHSILNFQPIFFQQNLKYDLNGTTLFAGEPFCTFCSSGSVRQKPATWSS